MDRNFSHPQHVLQRSQPRRLYLVQVHAGFVHIPGHGEHSRLPGLRLSLQNVSELLEEVVTWRVACGGSESYRVTLPMMANWDLEDLSSGITTLSSNPPQANWMSGHTVSLERKRVQIPDRNRHTGPQICSYFAVSCGPRLNNGVDKTWSRDGAKLSAGWLWTMSSKKSRTCSECILPGYFRTLHDNIWSTMFYNFSLIFFDHQRNL